MLYVKGYKDRLQGMYGVRQGCKEGLQGQGARQVKVKDDKQGQGKLTRRRSTAKAGWQGQGLTMSDKQGQAGKQGYGKRKARQGQVRRKDKPGRKEGLGRRSVRQGKRASQGARQTRQGRLASQGWLRLFGLAAVGCCLAWSGALGPGAPGWLLLASGWLGWQGAKAVALAGKRKAWAPGLVGIGLGYSKAM